MAVTRIPIPESAKDSQVDERLDLSIAETKLTVRTVNCLEEQGIFTVRDLLNCTPKRLLEIPNFGEVTLKEVYKALAKLGFHPLVADEQQDRQRRGSSRWAVRRKRTLAIAPAQGHPGNQDCRKEYFRLEQTGSR